MSSGFVTTFKGTYIRVEHPQGYELTEKSVFELWQELGEICREYQCFKVLAIWVAPRRRLSVMNSYGSGETASRFLSGVKLACCFQEYEPDGQTEFFATVAHNRGVNIAVFTDEREALRWLGVDSPEQENPRGS